MACSATRGSMSDDGSTMIRAMRWMDDCPVAVRLGPRWREVRERRRPSTNRLFVVFDSQQTVSNSKFSESLLYSKAHDRIVYIDRRTTPPRPNQSSGATGARRPPRARRARAPRRARPGRYPRQRYYVNVAS